MGHSTPASRRATPSATVATANWSAPGGAHGLRARDGAVAVGVGLDHAHQLDAAADLPSERGGVAPQGGEVDLNPRPAASPGSGPVPCVPRMSLTSGAPGSAPYASG